ncbi:MAG: TolC family protein [Alphaproteobacteria bacterium]|nr:TolC family protein [Alphaproteobacteria bacterium]
MKKTAIILCGVLFLQNAHALDLTLNDAVSRIQTESHDLKKADANLRRARAGLDSANSNRWFKIDGTATYMNIINVENPGKPLGIALPADVVGASGGMIPAFMEFPSNIGMAGATLSLPIYTFGQIGNAVDAARDAIKMAESGNELARREVAAAAAQMYWTAKMTDDLVKIAENNLKASKDAERKLTSAGRANRLNLVKITADVAAKEIALSDAEFNRDSAHRMLKILAGVDMEESLNLIDEFPNSFVALDAPAALESNPEWDLFEYQAKMFESSARAKRAARYPTLGATASYNYIATHTDASLWNGVKNQSAYWGVSLSVPLFDGGSARANATMDAMEAEAVRQDLDKSKKMKSNEYTEAVLKHAHLRENFGRLNEARDLAAKTAQISFERFAAGQTSAVELSDVQAALAQMDMAVLNAKFNILMSEENVRKLGAK